MGVGTEIGVDIGGTFTDIVCRAGDGSLRFTKVPTTGRDPSRGVLQAIGEIETSWALPAADVTRFAHGTTVATNAVLERKGARIGLVTTAGFRDIIEIGRQMRHQVYQLVLEPETPTFLLPGSRRKEVPERISAQGEILVPLDETALERAADELVADGVEAIAICFLFSFVNADHEKRARELILARHPQLIVSVSHEVDPAFREYERTVVTAFDAYVKPVIDRYLDHLEGGLVEGGVPAPLQVMQSRGGLMAAKVARQRPVRMFLSGPAAGVIGARIIGRSAGMENLITADIGGTSCDIALISQGKPLLRPEGVIDGYPVRVSMVDVNSIGAGGGSIAWVDRGGGLRVGPESAGSDPGPACYARGGEAPTVTDASVVLGYLNPEFFAGGTLQLETERAHRAIEEKIARPLGLSVERAALGIHRVVNAQMAEGIRLVSIRQGLDPRKFVLLPLGGGGPVHATALARALSIETVVVPRIPGVLSAAGLLAAPVEHEVSTAFGRALADVALGELRGALAGLDRDGAELMAAERVEAKETQILYFADVCYVGQGYFLEIPIHLDDPKPLERLYEDFLVAHDRVYGYSTRAPARVVNLRTVHRSGGLTVLDGLAYSGDGGDPIEGTRSILVAEGEAAVEATVLRRDAMAPGYVFAGPAVVEQRDTTTLVEPDWKGRVDEAGNLVLEHLS